MILQQYKWFGGALLIAGTTIGGGMLALPVSSGLSGFIPSSLLLIIYWILMTYTAFLMLEVNLWIGKQSNLISMAHFTLGRWGEIVSWVTYLFLLYSLTTAYIAGGSKIVLEGINAFLSFQVPAWGGFVPLLAVFGFFIWMGMASVDIVNRILMIGLFVGYVLLLFVFFPQVDFSLLNASRWEYLLSGVSMIVLSFGFHIIIPTLTIYLDRDVNQLKKALWVGCGIPLIVYLIWQFISLGNIPFEGKCGLLEGYKAGNDVMKILESCFAFPGINFVAKALSFFMILTSFLGVSISLSDFLSDGLKVKKRGSGKIIIYTLTFFPPLLFVWYNPRAFFTALEYAGAFGVVILLVFLPTLMAWRGRYYKGYIGPLRTWGGKPAMFLAILVACISLGIELARQMGLIFF